MAKGFFYELRHWSGRVTIDVTILYDMTGLLPAYQSIGNKVIILLVMGHMH